MSSAILQTDEWLVFELDGVSFALPNNQSQKIGVVNDLLSETLHEPIPHLQDKLGHNIYMLDQQLKPDFGDTHKRSLYLLLSENDKSIGLLCDSADIIHFTQHDIQAYSIPVTMSHSDLPLVGIALSDTEKPIYLSQAKNIMLHIQNLSIQKMGAAHE